MSKYTTQLRFICETEAGYDHSAGYNHVAEVIQNAISKIFDFDFPIYDESYRNVLCTKILRHYYTREIGAETYGLWKLWLDTKLNEIMPYYNQMYKSAMLDFNPFYDVDLTRDYKKNTDSERNDDTNATTNVNGTTSGTSDRTYSSDYHDEGSSSGWDLYSDTPQGSLSGVSEENYLTNARKTTGTTSQNGDSGTTGQETYGSTNKNDTTEKRTKNEMFTNVDSYIEHVKGKQGTRSYSYLLSEYRNSLINIDLMIIDELADLFFNLW